MTELDPTSGYVVLINTFAVAPEKAKGFEPIYYELRETH